MKKDIIKPKQFFINKCNLHGETIKQWLKGENPYAVTTEIDLCGFCNHKCSFCFFKDRHFSEYICRSDIESVLCQIKNKGGKAVVFTGGGEPLLNPNICEITKTAKNLGLDLGLVTNGSRLHTIADVKHLFTWIRISLDAALPETYKKMHGMDKQHFKKVLDNIAALHNTSCKTTIGIAFMVTEATLAEIEIAAWLGKKLGVHYIQFRPLMDDHIQLDDEIIKKAKKYETKDYQVFFVDRFFNKSQRNYTHCLGNFLVTVITADLNVYTCCHMRGVDKYCLGNLKTNSLDELWARRCALPVNGQCPKLCRLHYNNNILQQLIGENIQHVNFL